MELVEAAGPSHDLVNQELGSQAATEDQWEIGEMVEEEMVVEVEGEEWSVLDQGSKEIPPSYPVFSLPRLTDDIEQRLKEMSKMKTYKPKQENEDKSFASFTKKIFEKVRGKSGENITIDEVADGEQEDSKRIYDVMNILEGIGLTSKTMKRTYKCHDDENMKKTLVKLKELALGNDLERQVSIAMVEKSVLEFNQNKENQEEEREKTKDFHLTQLTEKILMILMSLEKTQFLSAKQILPLLTIEEGLHVSRGLQISKVLVGLHAVGLLSVDTGMATTRGRDRKLRKLIYRFQYPDYLDLGGKESASAF
jgi:hypothetical protein